MSWNPVLSDEPLKGMDRMTRPAAKAGEIVVLFGRSGAYDVLAPGSSPTAGEMRLRTFQRAVRLTANPHRLEQSYELPTNDLGVVFTADISLDVRVEPRVAGAAAKAFASTSASASDLVSQRLRSIATPICSRHDQNSRQAAQDELLDTLQTKLDLSEWGFIADDIAVSLRLPPGLEQAIGERTLAEAKRQNELADLHHGQEVDERKSSFGRDEKRKDAESEIALESLREQARAEKEIADHEREMKIMKGEEEARLALDAFRRRQEIDLTGEEKMAVLEQRLAALQKVKELGSLTETELNRLFLLENPDAPERVLGSRTRQIEADRSRAYDILQQLIAGEEIDLRREEDRELLEKLLPGGQGDVTAMAAPQIATGDGGDLPAPDITPAEDDLTVDPDGDLTDAEIVDGSPGTEETGDSTDEGPGEPVS
jgi:hypothetical protein